MDETQKQSEEIMDVSLPEKELDKVVGGEAVSLSYKSIEWTYAQQKPDGTEKK
jgi:type VI protein secretion system component Hcp